MTIERTAAPMEVSEDMIEDNLRLLLRDLCTFANRDSRFQRGQSDYSAIEVTTGDQIMPEWEGGGEDTSTPVSDLTFRFIAERRRYYDDEAHQRAWVRFIFSVTGRHSDALLPGHIAEERFGSSAEEVSRELGPIVFCREQRYTFLTRDCSFEVCDSYAYLDEDDDPISEACTCHEQDVIYVTNASTIEEVEHSLTVAKDSVIDQYATQDVEERATHEPITIDDIDQAVEEWTTSTDLGNHMEREWQLKQIQDARFVVESIHDAILVKLGLKQPKE